MKYCADTWFILKLFEKDVKAISIITEIKFGKSFLFIPITVFTESTKKLMQKGFTNFQIDEFFSNLESSSKIEFLSIDKKIAKESAKLSLSYDLSIMDSFVVASSKLSECDLLLSEDSDYRPLIKSKYVKLYSW